MRKLSILTVCVMFLAFVLGLETKGVAQPKPIKDRRSDIEFSNREMTTDCCPRYKDLVDSIVNNAPFVLEGRIIKKAFGTLYRSYLFEIKKAYRGGERLQAGTIELITKMPIDAEDPPLVSLANSWHILFAKEIDMQGSFDANNTLKLEFFYNDEYKNTSFFEERTATPWIRAEGIAENESYISSALYLNFRTKEATRDFLATYNLFPTDFPQVDTLKTLSDRDKEIARQEAIQAAELKAKRVAEAKIDYRMYLEMNLMLDSLSGEKISRKNIDKAVNEYDKVSDIERDTLLKTLRKEYFRKANRIIDANMEKKKI